MTREEILVKANVEEDLWEYCFIDENGGIWQPQMTFSGKLFKNGEELYQDSLNPPLIQEPTIEERIKATEDTLLMLMDMQTGGI